MACAGWHKVAAALGEPGRVTRLADAAADQALHHAGSFLAEVGRRWPALADKVAAALDEPGRVTRLADAADHDLGNTGSFLVQVGGVLADKVAAALGEPGRVTRLADAAADHDLGNTGSFLVQVGRRWPALAGHKVVAALDEPGRVTRLADAFLKGSPSSTMTFLRDCRKLMPTVYSGIMSLVTETDRNEQLANLITRDFRYSGGFLEHLYKNHPEVAERLLHRIIDRGDINSLALRAAPTEGMARSARALIVVAEFFNSIGEKERARRLLENLLGIFGTGIILAATHTCTNLPEWFLLHIAQTLTCKSKLKGHLRLRDDLTTGSRENSLLPPAVYWPTRWTLSGGAAHRR